MATRSIQKERTNPQGNPKIRVENQSRVKEQEGNQQIQNTLFKTRFTHKGSVKTQQRQSEKIRLEYCETKWLNKSHD